MSSFSKFSFPRSLKFSKRLFSLLHFKNSYNPSFSFFPSSLVESRCFFLHSLLFHSLFRSSRLSSSPSPFFSSPSSRRLSFSFPFSLSSSRLFRHKFFFFYYLSRSSFPSVESRLDSSLLRLLLFYPSFFFKLSSPVKPPFLFYSPSQARQFINHRHLLVNLSPVSFRSFSLRPSHRLSFRPPFLSPLSFSSSPVLALKRFTEAFFLLFNNFHLFSHNLFFFLSHLRPFFLSFGLSQSPFFL